jgi:hypothetical protein
MQRRIGFVDSSLILKEVANDTYFVHFEYNIFPYSVGLRLWRKHALGKEYKDRNHNLYP